MHDETNEQTSNQRDRIQTSSREFHAASEELHVLSAESLDLVAGGPDGAIIIVGRS
jgi:hypothetical protein